MDADQLIDLRNVSHQQQNPMGAPVQRKRLTLLDCRGAAPARLTDFVHAAMTVLDSGLSTTIVRLHRVTWLLSRLSS
jgi:hypothetical protein